MFYYTNFVMETNAWWNRRVRPIWVGGVLIWAYYLFHRYYFFGSMAVKQQRAMTKEENERRAEINKRSFGFGHFYKPTYEKSIKKQVMEALGDNYDYSYKS